jgi:NADPH:quinone reductase-like Zn-dependent oxidoreductase
MRAIVLEKFGGLDGLVYKEIPDPEPKAGYVVIEIKAFGINHAEMHMRRGEWAEAAKVIGNECVGLVKSCPSGEFPVGAKVAAIMGGLDYASTTLLTTYRARATRFHPRSLRGVSGGILKAERGVASCGGGL